MLELSFYDNFLLTILSFFTAVMTSLVGAGGGTVLLAAMLQFMNPSEAIPVHGVIQFTSNIARAWLLRKFVKWGIILKFSLMIPLGVYLGLEIFQSINAEDIKKLIGSFIIIALILQNIKFIKKFIISSNWYYIVGFTTGILNILVGVIAPLLAVIVKQSINDKKSIVGTLGYFGLVGNFTKIIGFSFIEYINTLLLMTPATLLGSRIGQFLLDKISNKLFFYVFQIILIGLALRLLLI